MSFGPIACGLSKYFRPYKYRFVEGSFEIVSQERKGLDVGMNVLSISVHVCGNLGSEGWRKDLDTVSFMLQPLEIKWQVIKGTGKSLS